MTDIQKFLDSLPEEDKNLVRDVFLLMKSFNIFSNCQSNVIPKRYELIGWINNTQDVTFGLYELELLRKLNDLRVEGPFIKIFANNAKICVMVRVIPHKEPAMIVEQEIQKVVKRRKTLFGF